MVVSRANKSHIQIRKEIHVTREPGLEGQYDLVFSPFRMGQGKLWSYTDYINSAERENLLNFLTRNKKEKGREKEKLTYQNYIKNYNNCCCCVIITTTVTYPILLFAHPHLGEKEDSIYETEVDSNPKPGQSESDIPVAKVLG